MQKKTDGRNGTIDIFRLFYALVIMAGHSVSVGVTSPFAFEPVGILVEFFLCLTGYFTCKAFTKRQDAEPSNYFIDGLKYTLKKFKVFMPYVLVSVVLSYSINIISIFQNRGGIAAQCRNLFNMVSEMFLLNYSFAEIGQRVGPLYYLAALLIVLPVFCVLCQVKNRSVKIGIALYVMLFYYHDMNVAVTATYPQILLRALSGLCAGIVICYGIRFFDKYLSRGQTGLLKLCRRIAAVVLLVVPLVLSGLQIADRRLALICEVLGLMFVLSKKTDLSGKSGNVTDLAAKMSMVVYILHWSIGQNISFYIPDMNIKLKLVLYYAITLIMAVILIMIVEWTKKKTRGKCYDRDV